MSDERGYRRDVLEAAKDLRMPILRWPGGNFVSGYHLTDGIGRREERPKKTELAWFTEESNRFGTDEYIEYCRVLGTEPYICVNMGTGTIDEAQAWVEYCNGADTYWANLRRQNGHEEPVVLDAYVECGKHALEDEASFWPLRVADMGPFDVLDSSATRDESGRDLTLVVVNRDPERDIQTYVQLTDAAFDGTVTAYEVTGDEPGATNDFGQERVGMSERSVEAKGGSFEHAFPACSVTFLRAGLAG